MNQFDNNNSMHGMTFIVKNVTRIVIGFIILFGIYTVFTGQLSPGGGFAGGVVIALGFVLLVLAFGRELDLSRKWTHITPTLDSLGGFALLLLAFLGIFGGAFFLNFLGKGTPFRIWSGGVILWMNAAIGIKVAASLAVVFLALAGFNVRRFVGRQTETETNENKGD